MLSTIPQQTKQHTSSFIKKLLQNIALANRRWRLFQRNDSILVALSGGPDSVALLMLLARSRRKYDLRLAAAHLYHGIHTGHSERYLHFCQKLCHDLGIPLAVRRVNIPNLARRHKRGLEEMGRIERYRFFEETATKLGMRKIATAHTLDDQAETMLMRIIRGSGMRGLVGIPIKRKLGRLEIIRPLLLTPKKEILSWMKRERISFCTDPTNRSSDFLRNRLRNDLLPGIERIYNPQIIASLSNLQRVASHAVDFLERASKRAYRRCLISERFASVCLSSKKLPELHPALQGEVLLKAVEALKGDPKGIAQIHVQEILDILASQKGGNQLRLPGGILVRKRPKFLQISKKRDTIRAER